MSLLELELHLLKLPLLELPLLKLLPVEGNAAVRQTLRAARLLRMRSAPSSWPPTMPR